MNLIIERALKRARFNVLESLTNVESEESRIVTITLLYRFREAEYHWSHW